MAPELTTKANDLIIALGRLAAAQECGNGTPEVDALLASASDARDEIADILGPKSQF